MLSLFMDLYTSVYILVCMYNTCVCVCVCTHTHKYIFRIYIYILNNNDNISYVRCIYFFNCYIVEKYITQINLLNKKITKCIIFTFY